MRRVLVLALILAAAACSAGDAERNAICERGSAIEVAILRTGDLAAETRSMNAAVLRSQLDEDMTNLGAALDVAPQRIVNDLSTVLSRLRDLYGALELLDWDSARFVSDARLDDALTALDSVNTRRHLARLSGYLVESCEVQTAGGSVPADSIVAVPSTSTSVVVLEDPIPEDLDASTAHVALGTAIAESFGFTVTVEEAACLGREAEDSSIALDDLDSADPVEWQRKWEATYAAIFPRCGLRAPDRPAP